MKILFIQKDVFAKPAVMALSAALKKEGHKVLAVIDDLENDLNSRIINEKADLIGFSITTGEYPWMKKTGEEIKKFFKGTVICGGAHPTFYPEVIRDDYLDAICVGEGDHALLEFVSQLDKGNDVSRVGNFVVKQNGKIFNNRLRELIPDLDELPFYDRSVYKVYLVFNEAHNDILYHNVVITGRGCPYKCSFCFNKAYNDLYKGNGKIVRRRSVENVIDELVAIKKNEKPDFITFDDDTFTIASEGWINELLTLYGERIKIPFKLNARASHLNENLVRRLKKAGCFAVKIGVESGNSDLRNNLLQKDITNKNITDAAFLLKKYGIRFQTFNMLGNPGETIEMAMETYNLNKKIRPDFVWCSLLNPYPGTKIFEYAKQNNYLENTFNHENYAYSYFGDTPVLIDEKQKMVNLQKLLWFGVFFQLPDKIMKIIIGLPLSALYNLIFGFGMFIGLNKINKIHFAGSLKITLKYLVKYNFESKKRK